METKKPHCRYHDTHSCAYSLFLQYRSEYQCRYFDVGVEKFRYLRKVNLWHEKCKDCADAHGVVCPGA